MNYDDIASKVRAFVREEFKVPEADADFDDDVHLFDFGYVDSFGAVNLTSFVESLVHITVAQNDMIAYPLNTIREIATFADKRQRGLL